MAIEILDAIGTYIKDNNSYFDSFRVNGIQIPGGEVVEFADGQEKKFIGIGDNVGTSGYIRFNPQIAHSQAGRRISSMRSGSFVKRCRLVAFTFNSEPTSEQLMTKLVTDLKRIPFATNRQKPVIRITQMNHNYTDILQEEFKKEIGQVGAQQFTCISIDFELTYFEGECEICDQGGSVASDCITFSGIQDSGPPYNNSLIHA